MERNPQPPRKWLISSRYNKRELKIFSKAIGPFDDDLDDLGDPLHCQ
jgi:hypothetical protein